MGGRVDQYKDGGFKSGPYRVWMKNEQYPGLAMSRSIGDLIASKIGVTPEPGITYINIEIIEHTITPDCKYIVIASDGVWEFLDNNAVADIVHPYYIKDDPKGAVEHLIQTSVNWWEKVN
jgi:serine/threonine protein phosphatase PrpC